jgi:outer membrane autotransporter protein
MLHGASWLLPLLAGCILAMPGGAVAASIDWGANVDGNWKKASNWSPASVPGAGDAANIGSGTAAVNDAEAAASVKLSGTGTLVVKDDGVLTVKDILDITGGTLKGDGSITLTGGLAPAVTQSGGLVNAIIATPRYTLTGGTIGNAGAISVSTTFEMSGTGVVNGGATITGTDPAAKMSQSGALSVEMGGTVTGLASYAQSGGTMSGSVTTGGYTFSGGKIAAAGIVDFTGTFDQSGGTVASGATVTGTGDSADMKLSGNDSVVMSGTVTGITGFTQSGGKMSGSVTTDSYSLQAGTIAGGAVNFATGFEQTGGTVNGNATLTGETGSTMSLSGAESVMNGTVTGIETFTQSDGDMGGEVTTVGYNLAGGQVSGGSEVKFSGAFEQTDGLVTGAATLTGGDGSTMSLSGDTSSIMAGTVTGLASFDQSGGKMGGTVTTAGYILTDGRIDATGTVNFADSFAQSGGRVVADAQLKGGGNSTVTLSGDAADMNGTVTGVKTFTQSGGDMGGSVTATNYELSGGRIHDTGTIAGSVDFSTAFALSGGEIESNTTVTGGDNSTLTQSGGKLSGAVDVATYDLTSSLAQFAGTGTISASDSFGIGPTTGTIDIAARLTGAGDLTKSGASSVTLSNAGNDYTGDTIVDAGLLSLAGTLTGSVTVHDGATLGGTASVGQLTIDADGILAPGNSIGTMRAATLDMASGSYYDVEIDAAGNSDETIVTGLAKLDGTVRVTAAGGSYSPSSSYTILSAGSLEGAFDDVSIDLLFLDPKLAYSGGDVLLNLVRNDIGFSFAGDTPNQKAAAGGAESLGAGNPVYDAILWLTSDEAKKAFDVLSGEAYASSTSAFLQNSNLLADLTLTHIDQALSQSDEDEPLVLAYAGDDALPALPGSRRSSGAWAQAYGGFSSFSGSGTSDLDAETGGLGFGFDGMAGNWLVGVMAQAGATHQTVDALASTMDSTDYGFGIYGGRSFGPVRLSFGSLYMRHDIDTSRDVDFPGYTDSVNASYSAGTAQAFARLSYGMRLGGLSVAPFASLAYADQKTDAFTESGGPAALTSEETDTDAIFSTLGFGFGERFAVAGSMLTLRGQLGWRHAFGNDPEDNFAFDGSDGFGIVGTPIATDLLVAAAGVSMSLGAASALGLSYDGQIGADAASHIFRAAWSRQF